MPLCWCDGMYVLHKPLRRLLEYYGFSYQSLSEVIGEGLLTQGLYTVSMMLITFALAWVVWHVFEKQFLKLRVFLPYQGGASTAVPSTALPATQRAT